VRKKAQNRRSTDGPRLIVEVGPAPRQPAPIDQAPASGEPEA
jgi:hypothetical protein